jgi:hypothetical protein
MDSITRSPSEHPAPPALPVAKRLFTAAPRLLVAALLPLVAPLLFLVAPLLFLLPAPARAQTGQYPPMGREPALLTETWRVSYVVRPLLDEHAVEVVAVLFGEVGGGVVWRHADPRLRRGEQSRPEAMDGFGQPLRVDAHPRGWTVTGGSGGGMRLSWRVTVPGTAPVGAAGLGISAEALYGPGYELFLIPDPALTAGGGIAAAGGPIQTEVIFDIPISWRILVPWEGFGRNYRPSDPSRLWSTILAAGDFRRQNFQTAGMEVVVGIQGRRPEEDLLIVQVVRRVLTAGQQIFGALPAGSLTVLIPSVAAGGAASLRLGESLALGWGEHLNVMENVTALHTLARELLRLWLGPDGSAPAWFAEGGTDYLAWLALLRQELIQRDQFRQQILRSEQVYLAHPHASDWTFVQEEARLRASVQDPDAVPPGTLPGAAVDWTGSLARERGVVVALALDATIARLSRGQRRFTDLARAVWRRRNLQTGTVGAIQDADLMAACATVTGGDYLDGFFQALIFAVGRPPTAEALADIMNREER